MAKSKLRWAYDDAWLWQEEPHKLRGRVERLLNGRYEACAYLDEEETMRLGEHKQFHRAKAAVERAVKGGRK